MKLVFPFNLTHFLSPAYTLQKYHSIHKSGKRLEDVLSKEELDELRQ